MSQEILRRTPFRFKVRTGESSNLSATGNFFGPGEPAWSTDTNILYMGQGFDAPPVPIFGRSSSAALPSTTELPISGDATIHNDTSSGEQSLAYNDNGDIRGIVLGIDGSLQQRVKVITFADSPYSVLASDIVLEVDSSGGAVTVDLPSISTSQGRVLLVSQRGANAVTINGDGADTINGAATLVLNTLYAAAELRGLSTEWGVF